MHNAAIDDDILQARLGFRGSGCGVWGLGFEVWGVGFRAWCLAFGGLIFGLRCLVFGGRYLGSEVWDFAFFLEGFFFWV